MGFCNEVVTSDNTVGIIMLDHKGLLFNVRLNVTHYIFVFPFKIQIVHS